MKTAGERQVAQQGAGQRPRRRRLRRHLQLEPLCRQRTAARSRRELGQPQAPVLTVTATDARTVSIKLKEPLVYALDLFAVVRQLHRQHRHHAEGGRERLRPPPRHDRHRPVLPRQLQPSRGLHAQAQPGLLGPERQPGRTRSNYPIVTEYAQAVAQLKAGNIHYFQAGLRAEDVFPLKKDEPRLQIYALDLQTANPVVTFGQLPAGKRNPFADERVRQAFSMSWDRDAWIDAFFNVPDLEAGGLPVDVRWNSALPADFGTDWWLDPQGKDFGANAKYYQYNLAEAKKLLAAAGARRRSTIKSNRITTNAVANLARYAEALEAMVLDAGFKIDGQRHRLQHRLHPADARRPTASTKASAATPSPAPRPGASPRPAPSPPSTGPRPAPPSRASAPAARTTSPATRPSTRSSRRRGWRRTSSARRSWCTTCSATWPRRCTA